MQQINDQQLWLQTIFQSQIEASLQLLARPAPEQTPYVHKYVAIKNLQSLVSRATKYVFIPYLILGEAYSEVEQTSDSFKSFTSAMVSLNKLNKQERPLFANYLMTAYNMLGFCYVNREEFGNGLGCLQRALQIHQWAINTNQQDCFNNRCLAPFHSKLTFRPFYQGGINRNELHKAHTLTHFYLAQCYAKQSLKDKAAKHCGITLQFQYKSGQFQINEFCHNLIGLSDYYANSSHYSQASYLIMLAINVLPINSKRKMRATVLIALGKLYARILNQSCERLKAKEPISEQLAKTVNKRALIFDSFDSPFTITTLPTQIEGCKSLFRIANTQLSKALNVFVLDGFVTEYVQIMHQQSALYKAICLIETNRERVMAMLEKRRDLIEPLLKEINPKAFAATWQRLLVEAAQIANQMFYLRLLISLDVKGCPSEAKLVQANSLGQKAIVHFESIQAALLEDKDAAQTEQFFRSIVNAKFNAAKVASKMASIDVKTRVAYLKDSWMRYQNLAEYIQKQVKPQLKQAFKKEIELTDDMIRMLPSKIDRINYRQVSPLQ